MRFDQPHGRRIDAGVFVSPAESELFAFQAWRKQT
jgi:hypothetical protein